MRVGRDGRGAHVGRAAACAGGVAKASTGRADAVARQARLRVTVAVQPPAYRADTPRTEVDPDQLQVVEGSALLVSVESSAARVSLEHDGRIRDLVRGADGRFVERLTAIKTGYLLIIANDEPASEPPGNEGEATPKPSAKASARRLVPLTVSPDALPTVRITAPGRDLVYAGGDPRITFDAHATDDVGLRSLMLRFTRVTGSGENYEFQEGEIPLSVTEASPREWTGRASRSLAELNLKDGDTLVYRAVASDARPGDGSASSDAFFIEISKLGVAAGDAFTLPEEESKYALSQQMLIVKTERLHRRSGSLSPDEFAEQALNLAVEQRMIRAEFVFMLGGEINDEEVEAEQSVELQAGRLQNRGQRDLRAATIAMSQAEKLLTGASTAQALVAERAAVNALQRAFSRDRYILRAMATRSQLDATRRLTGNLTDAAGWRRARPDAPANRRAALLEDLLRGISELGSDLDFRVSVTTATDVSKTRKSRSDPAVLAEEAIRIDPASAPLRQAATALQRAATATGSERNRAIAEAAAAATTEARRAHADAAVAPSLPAAALSGAFADALRRSR